MARHVRVQCALIRPQGTKDSTTRDPDVNHSTFNTHTRARTHTRTHYTHLVTELRYSSSVHVSFR